jgi:transcriptional regulator of arginine metabolism
MLDGMNKNLRQSKIVNLVQRERPISTQIELSRKLSAEGITVTQGTLSRDLRELNLLKTPEGYRLPAQLQNAANPNHQRQTIVQFMTEAQAAGNLVVVKTNPGNASPVARSLDTIGWGEIVGTVAGDDTILVVTANAATARLVTRKLLALGE